MKIATWNVNSIRARQARLLAWLESQAPDVLCVQETKVVDGTFPEDIIREGGYRSAFHGQKTYNGVAILSRQELSDVERGFGHEELDEQARLISATVSGVRVVCVYVPNGKSVGSESYEYKLRFLAQLRAWLGRYDAGQPLVLCGDFNIAPDDRDVHDPAAWKGEILCSDLERKSLERIIGWGLRDVFRDHHEDGGLYSWWDYRQLGFPKNRGLRIDHIYATESLAARCSEALIDREERKGKQPSDHAPVVAVFDP